MRGYWRSLRPIWYFHRFLSESSLILLTFNISKQCLRLSSPKSCVLIVSSNLNHDWGPALLRAAQRQSKNTGSNERKEGISKQERERKRQKPWEAPGSFFSLQPEGGSNATCLLATPTNQSLSAATAVSVLTDAMQWQHTAQATFSLSGNQRTWEKNKIFEKIITFIFITSKFSVFSTMNKAVDRFLKVKKATHNTISKLSD